MTEPLLSVRDLSVTYQSEAGDVPAVRGVSFDLAPGETLGLAGESGCGKSTIAGALLKVLPPGTRSTGEVLLDGEDVLQMKPGAFAPCAGPRCRSCSRVRCTRSIPSSASATRSPRRSRLIAQRRMRSARVAELLETVGIPARRSGDYPHQLSGGQRQRVLIALALACNPRMLIADEPTTALDVMVQAQVLELLERLQRELALSMIFITHDLSTLSLRLQATAVMYAGRIVEEGRCARGLRPSAPSVHGRARRGLPAHRRPHASDGAVRARRRPAGSAGDPAWLPVSPALSGCRRRVPDDRRRALAGRGRAARCVSSTFCDRAAL